MKPETEPVPTQAPGTKNIAHGLLVAQRALKEVKKGSTNEFHNYDYTSADDLIKCAREALHQGDLTIALTGHELLPMPEITAVFDDPDVPPFIFVRSHFQLEHMSGEARQYHFDLPAVPGSGRPLDKAILGCMTTSTGYLLRDILQIPREDENEVSRRDDREVPSPRKAPTQTWQQKKAELSMDPSRPAAAPPAASTKGRLWAAITAWTGVQPAEAQRLGEVGRRIYEHLKMDTTGKAAEAELARASIWVSEQIRRKVDFSAWCGERDEAAAAEKALSEKPAPAATTAGIPDDDIPF